MRFFALFLFSLSLFLSTTFSAFDYFQLVLQWPPAYCRHHSPCRIPSPINFTIHGLWPSDSTKYGEIKCPAGNLNLGWITSLENRLGLEWPHLNGDNRWFWRYEWGKHGMCSAKWLNEFLYFKTALDLKNSVDLLQFMAEANITPSKVNIYNAKDIFEAIRKKTGYKPRLWCYNGKFRAKILLEISICVFYSTRDSAWHSFDCPPTLLYDLNRNCYVYGTGPVRLLSPH